MIEDIVDNEAGGNVDGEVFVYYSPNDKLRLSGRNWPVTNGECRAVVLIVHGSGEHCQRYKHMAHFFNTRQIAFVGFDMRGHGLSDGIRGYTPGLDALFDDIECVIDRVRTQLYPGVPLVVYAHGTGSLLCLAHIIRRPTKPFGCQAMIISTPSLCLKRRPTTLLLFCSRVFANLDPNFRLPVHGNYTNVYCNDDEVVKAYRNDPLVHDRWAATTLSIFMELGLLLEQNTVCASWPLLIQHGEADIITPILGIEKWVQKRVRGDVTFKSWPEHFHELHNDLGKEEILSYVIAWIEQKLNI
jgi:acylglycerol lipase